MSGTTTDLLKPKYDYVDFVVIGLHNKPRPPLTDRHDDSND